MSREERTVKITDKNEGYSQELYDLWRGNFSGTFARFDPGPLIEFAKRTICTSAKISPNTITWHSGHTGEMKRYQIINGNLTYLGAQ